MTNQTNKPTNMESLKQGNFILLPSDLSLTPTGIEYEKKVGNNITLSKYKILSIYWDDVYYPYPHCEKRIVLKKGAGKTHTKYIDTVSKILTAIN